MTELELLQDLRRGLWAKARQYEVLAISECTGVNDPAWKLHIGRAEGLRIASDDVSDFISNYIDRANEQSEAA